MQLLYGNEVAIVETAGQPGDVKEHNKAVAEAIEKVKKSSSCHFVSVISASTAIAPTTNSHIVRTTTLVLGGYRHINDH